jgi:D-xylose transport system permease protein
MSEQTAPDAPIHARTVPEADSGLAPGGIAGMVRALELDLRLIGMIVVLVAIWIVFDLFTGGRFITPRNLFNLSVQTASVAVMATGMVFVIVARHIDLSVGSLLGFLAMVMGVVQAQILPSMIGFDNPMTVVVTIAIGIALGILVGGLHGYIVGYLAVPAFIVTLGGLLVWRGAAWWVTTGQTVAPLDRQFLLFGGGILGTLGAFWSWVFGAVAIAGILFFASNERRRRMLFRFPVKPMWAEIANVVMLTGIVIAFVMTMNAYPLPPIAVQRLAEARGLAETPDWVHGIAVPVVVVAIIALAMTYVARATKFGRYVFAMGGNPQAAELSGIDTRRMTLYIFMLMGALTAISAVIASARLQSASNDLGSLDELRVIAAAVIGGTSLAGGVGTIYGAILGALVMQSLQSGMALVGVETSLQSIVIGLVLVLAVYIDQLYRRKVAT